MALSLNNFFSRRIVQMIEGEEGFTFFINNHQNKHLLHKTREKVIKN
jgi:hypothetical protein